jgi:hypothetical protein
MNRVYLTRTWRGLRSTYTFETVASTRAYDLPEYFSKVYSVAFDSGDDWGQPLLGRTLHRATELFHGQTVEGTPDTYWIKNNQIYLDPIPDSAETITMEVYRGSPNLWLHDWNIQHHATPASFGVQLYLDEDAVQAGIGKLYAVLPNTRDSNIYIATANNHIHTIPIYYSADAATLGVPIYFDDNATPTNEKMVFDSPTYSNCAVQTNATREHTHYIHFKYFDTPSGVGSPVYVDWDQFTAGMTFANNDGAANATVELIHTPNNGIFPLMEAYHELIYTKAMQYALYWLEKWSEGNTYRDTFRLMVQDAIDRDTETADVRHEAVGWDDDKYYTTGDRIADPSVKY